MFSSHKELSVYVSAFREKSRPLLPSSSFATSPSLAFMTCVALSQFELGLLGLHGFGGHLGALWQQCCLLSWSLRLDILEQEVADEKLQALPQHSQLGNSWNPAGRKTRFTCHRALTCLKESGSTILWLQVVLTATCCKSQFFKSTASELTFRIWRPDPQGLFLLAALSAPDAKSAQWAYPVPQTLSPAP